ncbi:MAG: hypothetical protein BWK72_20240 [Rhodoferax ferrireducens]|uniref:DUF4440 domain-containing protein n=1 Tax=Rhodoferax ferrireducens TaxID=192843 RepID=A0A1W9KPR8_9BURK|nr:MAG: hypothetical protein BWK72_20240 [Rhodoferax ferrireducens]
MLMRRHYLGLTLALACVAVSGCSRSVDPQASLEAAVQALQDNLEAKKTSAVMDLLDPQYRAQQELDRDWAKRTMTLMFLQHASVKVVALTRSSQIDPGAPQTGYTDAQVVLTGAQNIIPDTAAPYVVRLQWSRDGEQWKLRTLEWN